SGCSHIDPIPDGLGRGEAVAIVECEDAFALSFCHNLSLLHLLVGVDAVYRNVLDPWEVEIDAKGDVMLEGLEFPFEFGSLFFYFHVEFDFLPWGNFHGHEALFVLSLNWKKIRSQ